MKTTQHTYCYICICNYNITNLTNNCIRSIIKNIKSFPYRICVFDNSDIIKFQLAPDIDKNIVDIMDNTSGKLIDYTKLITDDYIKVDHNHGSVNHCSAIQWMIDNLPTDNIILIDGDAVLHKDIDFIDSKYCICASIQKTGDKIYQKLIDKELTYTWKNKFISIFQYINCKMLRDNNIRYFDPDRIIGGRLHQNYETGSSICEDVYNKKLPYKYIDYNEYLYHHCGSSHIENNEYIQPNLFFIWFGDNKPDYVDFSVNTFKEVNPNFNIQLIEYTVDEIETICSIEHGKMERTYKYNHDWLLNNAFHYVIQNLPNNPQWKRPHFTQTLLNNYKWWLINYFGGIYLDCDTFPIRPFDYTLLYNNKIESLELDRYSMCRYSTYMFGCIKGKSDANTKYINPIICGDEYPIQYSKKFYNCELKYGEHYNNIENCYVDHFCDKRWCCNNLKTFKSKLDKHIQ